MQSSDQTRSIRIIFSSVDEVIGLSTQLDDELTIRVLEACLKNMKEKTSLKAVPMGKENINDQRRNEGSKCSKSSFRSI